ncbi:MAG TPA: cation:proton antiporter [Clostridia bacterium]|nr:cation:proton antiporter [Clostridia bacterium]
MQMHTLFYLALMIFSGLILGRAVKQIRLPNVTGYLIAGLLIGPYVLKLIPADITHQFDIISEVALAFIAFSIGSEFKWEYLKKVGAAPVIIAVFEALAATVFVFAILVSLGFDVEISLLLGAIASATAPAATIMVVKQYGAKGPVTQTLLSVVALDDAIALIAFGFSMATVNTLINPSDASVFMTIAKPIVEIFGSIILGIALGFVFSFTLRFFKKDSNRMIITVGFIFLAAAAASMLGLSSLLLCMSMGMALINTGESGLAVFKLTDYITPPIFLLFFVISGAELDITILPNIGIIGIMYLIFRVIGKILGAAMGAIISKAPLAVRKYLGYTLIPQAGVAIGLSLIASQTLPEYGRTIRAVVLCATMIYELVGPAVTKLGLKKAGEI